MTKKPPQDANRNYLLKLQQQGICESPVWWQEPESRASGALFLFPTRGGTLRRVKLSQGHKTCQAHGSESIRLSFTGNIPASGSHKEALLVLQGCSEQWRDGDAGDAALSLMSALWLFSRNMCWWHRSHANGPGLDESFPGPYLTSDCLNH